MPEPVKANLDLLKGVSVLLAEDNVTNQLVATQMLKTMGADVDIASDGAIALERLKERSYDVLLIDIEMPRVSGLDVIRSIRSSPEPLSSAPVIALTAYAMQEHRDKIRTVGADSLIPKPITSIRQFGLDIRAVIDAKRASRPAPSDAAVAASVQIPVGQVDREIYNGLATSIGQESMAELMGRLVVDLRSLREDIEGASQSGDAQTMKGATHILVSISGAIGGVGLQRKSEALNTRLHGAGPVSLDSEAAALLPELDAVIDFVETEIGALARQ